MKMDEVENALMIAHAAGARSEACKDVQGTSRLSAQGDERARKGGDVRDERARDDDGTDDNARNEGEMATVRASKRRIF
jgi:hypothetical protein